MTVQPIHPPNNANTLVGFPSPTELEAIEAQVDRYAKSNLLPGAIRGKAADVFTVLMVARDLGLPATSGLFKVHVVDGRPTLAADLMVALGLQHGHDIWVEETTAEKAVAKGQRRGSERVTTITYTIEDAQRAGLAGKDNWKKNPGAMLRARALGGLCRVLIPDVLGGIAASTEESEDFGSPAPVAAPASTEEAAAALRQAAEPVDAEVVTDEPSDELQALVRDAFAAENDEALQAVWRSAGQNLDSPIEVGGKDWTLRDLITARVTELREASK